MGIEHLILFLQLPGCTKTRGNLLYDLFFILCISDHYHKNIMIHPENFCTGIRFPEVYPEISDQFICFHTSERPSDHGHILYEYSDQKKRLSAGKCRSNHCAICISVPESGIRIQILTRILKCEFTEQKTDYQFKLIDRRGM